MKPLKHFKNKAYFTVMLIFAFFASNHTFAQNGIIGSGFGTNDWSTTNCWSDGAGGSRIYTSTANGTGNQYFRLVTCWSENWNQWGPSSTADDLQITPNSAIGSSEVVENNDSKAYYINVANTSHNYVFKTKGGGNPPSNPALVVFCVQGTIVTVSSVSQPSYVHPGDAVTITAGLSASLSTGQAVYLRYTTDDWTNSTILAMTGSGTSYSADIPSGANVKDQTVKYYVFTSGNGLTISHSDADFYTINLNNSGSAYQYTPREIGWVNIQSPEGGTMMPGDDFNIYARLYINGITTENSESPNITAWIGYSTSNSDPSTWAEGTWNSASFNVKSGNNHEYLHNAKNAGLSAGTYYYASRFRYGDGSYSYGGFNSAEGNFWDGTDYVSGVLRFGKNSTTTGNWEENTSWDGDAPVAGEHVFIKNGHTITINSNVNVNSITIEAGGSLVVSGEYNITIGPNGSFKNNASFSGTQSTIILNGTSVIEGSSETQFNNITVEGIDVTLNFASTKINGILDLKAGSIINAPEFLEGSTLKYSQGGIYERVTEWNTPWHVQVANNTALDLNIGDFGADLSLRGNLIIDENSSVTIDAGHSYDLIVSGNLVLSGTLSLSTTAGSDLNIGGNWTRTGTFTPNQRMVEFNASSGTQQLTGHTTFDYLKINNAGAELVLNDGITLNNAMYVENGANLNMGTNLIDGAGSFELVNGGKLKIGSLEGITSTGASGNIQNTGTRTFGNPATYHYIGSGNQNSGNALPTATSAKNLIIELANSSDEFRINTSSAIEISAGGKLEIISGKLFEDLNAASGRHVDGAGDLVMSGGEYIFQRVAAATDVPRLTGTYNITGGSIVLEAIGDQKLNGGKSYNNIIFKNSGTVAITTTENINSVEIHDSKILNIGSSTFGKATTNLTMTGGRLIMTGARTLPDMNGAFNITGGVIEYAGSSTSHQVRGGKEYYNIEITGSNVSTSGANFDIKSGGTLSIKNAGQFTIASTRAIAGAGSFIVENGGILLYGSALGITNLPSTDGNVRVTGSRTYSPNATYGFIGGVNQVPGDGLPATVQNIIVDKSNTSLTVSLSNDYTITGSLLLNLGKISTGSNKIVLTNNQASAIVAGSANTDFTNSFIVGNLNRAIADQDNYYFPVGTSSDLQLARLDFKSLSSSGTPRIDASFISDASGTDISSLGLEVDGTLLTDRLDHGYWSFTPTDISSFEADIEIISDGFSNGSTNPFAFAVIKRNGGDWFLPDGTHNNSTQSINSGRVTAKRSGITSFSDYTSGYNNENTTLPIVLSKFDANRISDNEIEVFWLTESEINNDYFILEKSYNGKEFKNIAKIQGAGNSNTEIFYSHIDNASNYNRIYYRLKQVDFDNTFSYSDIISVSQLDNFYPSDFVSYRENIVFLGLNSDSNQKLNYKILNNLGQTITSNYVYNSLSQVHELNIYLPEGMYFVQIEKAGQVSTHKLIVTR